MNIDYYHVRGENLEVGDTFLWEGRVWIKLGPTVDEDGELLFPAFCLDPESGERKIENFDECGDALPRVDLDITVLPADARRK